ncbi:Uncharacterised protein [Streptococcus pneumoniae]|nr:Uncharacterised protein [Streptococcus pneumoniae]
MDKQNQNHQTEIQLRMFQPNQTHPIQMETKKLNKKMN